MNAGKKVNVNYSSLVGLKTELLRKQTEVEKAKAENAIRSSPIHKAKKVPTSKTESNTKEAKGTEKSRTKEIDDVNDFRKSRHMLELKSQLYEKLKKNPRANETEHFLVDFSEAARSSSPTNSLSPTDDGFNDKDWKNLNSSKNQNFFSSNKNWKNLNSSEEDWKNLNSTKEDWKNLNSSKEDRKNLNSSKDWKNLNSSKDWKNVDSNKEEKNSNSNEEDWVEYQDCFGRTRRCLRHELPKFQEEDSMIREEIKDKTSEKSETPEKPSGLDSSRREPEIEKLRKKWEEQSESLSYKQDIHYQDILFDEARMHGVGYYAFSSNEEERINQQKRFFEIRKETEQRQKEKQNIKEFKLKIEKNRLKAAKIRQRIRAGLPPEEEEEETENNLMEKEESSKNVEELLDNDGKKEENKLDVIEDKIKAFGELLGKRPKFRELSQEEWVEKRRKDRIEEFGPISNDFRGNCLLEGNASNLIVKVDGEDPLRIGVDGPEPTDLWDHKNISEECREREREEKCGEAETKNDSEIIGVLSNEIGNDPIKIENTNNLNLEKISEGLKYLRKKYDESENREN